MINLSYHHSKRQEAMHIAAKNPALPRFRAAGHKFDERRKAIEYVRNRAEVEFPGKHIRWHVFAARPKSLVHGSRIPAPVDHLPHAQLEKPKGKLPRQHLKEGAVSREQDE
uniref:hypothetical protein n=1 Tax=Burkholderia diffusa TaxID=488732 RepID=UPI001CC3B41B|nr:hypothetical protein [Burkholderia diffusa]